LNRCRQTGVGVRRGPRRDTPWMAARQPSSQSRTGIPWSCGNGVLFPPSSSNVTKTPYQTAAQWLSARSHWGLNPFSYWRGGARWRPHGGVRQPPCQAGTVASQPYGDSGRARDRCSASKSCLAARIAEQCRAGPPRARWNASKSDRFPSGCVSVPSSIPREGP
jgi:hypothetical protein